MTSLSFFSDMVTFTTLGKVDQVFQVMCLSKSTQNTKRTRSRKQLDLFCRHAMSVCIHGRKVIPEAVRRGADSQNNQNCPKYTCSSAQIRSHCYM